MTINLIAPELRELKPRIIVCGVGGGGCNAVNNMIASGLSGVDFLVANTDAQALAASKAHNVIQIGDDKNRNMWEGLSAGWGPNELFYSLGYQRNTPQVLPAGGVVSWAWTAANRPDH